VAEERFLPYQPDAESMPGPGRGYVAWQREAMGVNQESISLIAFDAAGMSEAVGTLYEMLAGLEPLTPLALAQAGVVQPAVPTNTVPELGVAWELGLDDRITGLRFAEDKLSVLTAARTRAEVSPHGAVLGRFSSAANYAELMQQFTPVDADAVKQARALALPGCLPKLVAENGTQRAVAYWGGRLELFDRAGKLIAARRGPQDLTAVIWAGPRLVVGDADGRLTALAVPAKTP